MRACLGLTTALAAVCVFGASRPVFRDDALSAELLLDVRNETPGRIAQAKLRLAEQYREIAATIGQCPESFQHARAMKRMEVAKRTVKFAETEYARGCTDGYAFALMATEDLKRMIAVFDDEIRLWKTYPFAPGVKPVVLSVADFGAKGDGKHDDGPAFRAAISNAVVLAGRPSVIEVPAGEFCFAALPSRDDGSHPCPLSVKNLTNCVIKGVSPEKTRLRFADYGASSCRVTHCENVTIADMDIAASETSFTQGTVMEFNKPEGWVIIKHLPGSMSPDDKRLVEGGKMQVLGIYDENRRQAPMHSIFYANRTDNLGDGRFRLHLQRDHFIYKRPSSRIEKGWIITVGDRSNIIGRIGISHGAYFCNLDNISVRNSRSAAMNFMDSLYSTAWRVKVFPLRPELIQASDADGIYSRRGTFIGRCEMRNLGDDGCNCNALGRPIDRVENGDTVVGPWLPGHYDAGDLFLVFRPTTGEFVYLGRVKRPGLAVGGRHATQFMDSLPELVTYESLGANRPAPEERLAMNVSGAKWSRCPDQMYRPYAFGIGFIVAGCRISDLRGTGCVVGCSNALIEDNVFEFMLRGVGISCLSNCTEGPAPYNVTVRGNVFHRVGTAIESRVVALGEGGRVMTAPVRGVLVERNHYRDVTNWRSLDFCGDDLVVADDGAGE